MWSGGRMVSLLKEAIGTHVGGKGVHIQAARRGGFLSVCTGV